MKKIQKMHSKYTKTILVVILFLPVFNFAQAALDTYAPLSPLPCIPSSESVSPNGERIPARTCGSTDIRTEIKLKDYVANMYNLFIALAAVATVFMIVWGGFQYMTSDAFQKKADGKKTIQNALWGLILVLTSYLILRTINPEFVEIKETLVEPLQLNIKSSIGDYLNDINKRETEYLAKSKALQDNIRLKEEEIRQLKNQFELATTLEEGEDLKKKILNAERSLIILNNSYSQINSLKESSNVSAMTSETAKYYPEVYSGAYAYQIEQQKNTALAALGTNATEEEKRAIEDQKNYSLGLLTINKSTSKLLNNSDPTITAKTYSYTEFRKIDEMIYKTSDPALKEELIRARDEFERSIADVKVNSTQTLSQVLEISRATLKSNGLNY